MSPGVLVGMPNAPASESTQGKTLTTTLSATPQAFLQPTPDLHAASLELAKQYLDPLASSVSETQLLRLQNARKKRKRGEREDHMTRDILRLKQLYLEGFNVDQVWEQARRVIDASRREADRAVRIVEAANKTHEDSTQNKEAVRKVRFDDHLEDVAADSEAPEDYVSLPDDNSDRDDSDIEEEEADEEQEIDTNVEFEEIDEDWEHSEGGDEVSAEQYVKDKHGLNDGFFSIDEFNRQTEFLERQDARGDPDDGAASDEEDIDWSVDPKLNAPMSAKESEGGMAEDESDGEDDGPTFGNADLNAPFDSSDDDEEGNLDDMEMDMDDNPFSNTNDVFYKDFFEPPPQPPSKKAKRPLPKTQPPADPEPDDIDADMQRVMSAVRRDIFEDDDEPSEASDAEGNKNLSSHERRQAKLAAQIRKLEAEAVAKREWAMSGEARATDRPINSLLEEDLEFERTGKPVPVVTAEVSSSIEELIKKRILARQFDGVPKRVPGNDLLGPPTKRRGLMDIDDRGPHQSLAEIYEAEHLKRTDPNYVDPRDTKLKAAHAQIERLWSEVSAKLDALSSWNYRPKPPAVEVSVITDTPRIAMEDARPSGVGIASEQSGLAPQEVYRAGDAKEKGEVLTKAGTIVGQGELSREEKQRHYRREREREKKAGQSVAKPNTRNVTSHAGRGKSKAKSEKENSRESIVEDLRRGGVKVIGKSGELVDVEGKKYKGNNNAKTAGVYKL